MATEIEGCISYVFKDAKTQCAFCSSVGIDAILNGKKSEGLYDSADYIEVSGESEKKCKKAAVPDVPQRRLRAMRF